MRSFDNREVDIMAIILRCQFIVKKFTQYFSLHGYIQIQSTPSISSSFKFH